MQFAITGRSMERGKEGVLGLKIGSKDAKAECINIY